MSMYRRLCICGWLWYLVLIPIPIENNPDASPKWKWPLTMKMSLYEAFRGLHDYQEHFQQQKCLCTLVKLKMLNPPLLRISRPTIAAIHTVQSPSQFLKFKRIVTVVRLSHNFRDYLNSIGQISCVRKSKTCEWVDQD